MVRWCQNHVSKLFQSQLESGLIRLEDVTNICNKKVVTASSHHRSPGSITGKSKIRAAK